MLGCRCVLSVSLAASATVLASPLAIAASLDQRRVCQACHLARRAAPGSSPLLLDKTCAPVALLVLWLPKLGEQCAISASRATKRRPLGSQFARHVSRARSQRSMVSHPVCFARPGGSATRPPQLSARRVLLVARKVQPGK